MNNTSPVDLSKTFELMNRISQLITSLAINRPEFVLDPRWTWLNASEWDGVMQLLMASQQMQGLEMSVNSTLNLRHYLFIRHVTVDYLHVCAG